MNNKKNILMIASAGGHLLQLINLFDDLNKSHNYIWISFDFNFVKEILANKKFYCAYYPTNRNFINLIRNIFLAVKIFYKEKPDVIISTGAGVAIPFFILGKLLNKVNIYIESFSRINYPSYTGQILYHISDLFFVQWNELMKYYPKAKYVGKLL